MRRFASLRRRGEFARLRRHGRRTATPNLTIYRGQGNPEGERPLVGITVSTQVGKAVLRNKVRRRVAASLHELVPLDPALRLLIVARPSSATASYGELHSELTRALS